MPEGDTVWLHAQRLHEALAGEVVTATDFRVPSLATATLTGRRITEVVSRGKHLLIRAGTTADTAVTLPDTAVTLHSHLRMDGTWRIFAPGERWHGRPAHLVRVVLRTEKAVAVGYHLHDVTLVPTTEEERLVGHLGPDLLGADWDPEEAVRRLRLRPEREISAALLDQRNLAGIGNLYRCEVLFLRGVSPWAPVSEVVDLPGLVALAHRLLMANRHRWAQITTGHTRKGEQTWVFGRAGAPCLRCGTTIRRSKDTGDTSMVAERVTYWCPHCQPGDPDDRRGSTRPHLARD